MIPFLRVMKPMVIFNGIPVSPLLTLDSADQSSKKGLCKLVYRHKTCTGVNIDIVIPFCEGTKASSHL